jgi:putative ABC transport system permease protein
VAFRNLLRQKLYSVLTIAGLAIGMSSLVLLGLYVKEELSFDRYHQQAKLIYRLNVHLAWAENQFKSGVVSARMGPALRQEFAEVEKFLRVKKGGETLFSLPGKELFGKEIIYADSTLFDFFDYKFLAGSPLKALSSPTSVVLTRSLAERLFGTTEVVGKVVTLKEKFPLLVRAVIEDAPQNHHLRFQAIVPYYNSQLSEVNLEQWDYFSSMVYLMLSPGTQVKQLEDKMPAFYQKYIAKAIGDDGSVKVTFQISFQPLTSIHLHSSHLMGKEEGSSIAYVYTFSAIGLFIFLIALVNYVNLATARSASRAKEVGIRKVVGSGFWQLVGQFLCESLLLAALSLVLSVILVQSLLPFFNSVSGKSLSWPLWQVDTLLFLVLFVLGTGLLSGLYPALVLTNFKPTQVLKGRFSSSSKGVLLRKSLVVFQFTLSIIMIIGTVIVYRQLHYMRQSQLGFNQEQVLVVNLKSPSVQQNVAVLKSKLLQNTAIKEVSTTNGAVGGELSNKTTFSFFSKGKETPISSEYFHVDESFLEVLQIPLKEGRNFSSQLSRDSLDAVLINEAMLQRLGWQNSALGTIELEGRKLPVTGVLQNFHLRSLHHQIEPLVLLYKQNQGDQLLIRIAAGQVPQALAYLQQVYKHVNPTAPFEYTFLDEKFARQYQQDEQKGLIFLAFSAVAIFIACLGLFGLAAYTAQQRTKEVGIRKVLGASVASLVALLSLEFVKLLLLAFLIASPLAYLGMQQWLEDFPYRIQIPVWVFVLAGGVALLVALLTVSYQSIKAALSNPVKSLRSE